jgi:ACS family tartrate transporter-like MFS transporter
MKPLYRKITVRLVPFLMLLYLVAFLNRVNISFAALTMNRDLQIGEGLFGLAAGMFFLGYFIFEVPGNMVLLRIGARRWIMLLMVTWGILSVANAFVPGAKTYILLRFLLGSAEAGFYPGVILYLTFWLPPSVRSSVMAIFVTAIPLSNLIGAPISAQIMLLDHMGGLKGWQWLFLMQGTPAVLLGLLVYFVLPDRPEQVHWLSSEEKQTLANDLSEGEGSHASKPHSLTQVFTAQPEVYIWSLAYFFLMIGLYGLGFWIPTVLASHGMDLRGLRWAAALPYLIAGIIMIWWSRRSDRRNERRFHLTAAFVASAVGFVIAAFAPNSTIAIAGFAIAAGGILAAMPVFWSASTLSLAGPMVGASIAVINSIGNLGGFVGPVLMGWLHEATHHYLAGLAAIALCMVAGGVCTAQLSKPPTTPDSIAEAATN